MDCIFCKIASGQIPSEKVYESERVLAFKDINPVAPEHILIIPKKHISDIEELNGDDSGDIAEILFAAKEIARERSLTEKGYRLILNNGKAAGQEVFHLHMHIIGGKDYLGPMIVK
ncbi:MAG TPA: histidine triad nucleotide-binding protein [Spirochaetota bacterium]|nr:histidine triad nucleotide-binding protein [Spirochaetota bacterium]HPF05871.1 histidine triad nucleotide-binding protein [Spirochaetota bacterium]HPJ40710.1 histidine triad nucleotide-binding protein [Spirochaetota bacterium]HPR35979.1 histidine triad nucleotide-binding protein [Spirochaetota bacterium]HRX45893.1 histidine triad nucleotide-binding protein [Spirochaetota bacterium]